MGIIQATARMCLLCTVRMGNTLDAYIISLLEYHRSLFAWFLLPSIIPGGQRTTGGPSRTAGGDMFGMCVCIVTNINVYEKKNNCLVTHNPEMYTPLPRKACWWNNGISAFQKKNKADILVCYASTGRMRVYIHNGKHKAQHMTNLLVMANEAAFWYSMLDSISKICK